LQDVNSSPEHFAAALVSDVGDEIGLYVECSDDLAPIPPDGPYLLNDRSPAIDETSVASHLTSPSERPKNGRLIARTDTIFSQVIGMDRHGRVRTGVSDHDCFLVATPSVQQEVRTADIPHKRHIARDLCQPVSVF